MDELGTRSKGVVGRVTRGRRSVAILVVGLIGVGAATGFALRAVTSASGSHTRLAIDITNLPAGSNAAVVVRGPNGFRRDVTASETLDVSPGAYRVKAAPVSVGTDRYYATSPNATSLVRVDRTAAAAVDYRTIVTTATHELSQTTLTTGRYSATDSSLTFSSTPPEVASLRPNDVLIVGSVPGAKDGLLVKVVSIATSGSQTTLSTEPAHLEDAVRRAHIHGRFTLAAQTSRSSTGPIAATQSRARTMAYTTSADGPSFDWSDTFQPAQLQGKGCGAAPKPVPASSSVSSASDASAPTSSGTAVSFTPSVHFGLAPVVDFTADVTAIPPSVKVSFTVGVNEDFSAGLLASAAYSCDITKSFELGTLPQFPLPIPGTPFDLTVTPKLSAKGEAKGKADGKVEFKVSQSAKPSVTLAYDNGFKLDSGFHPDPVDVEKPGSVSGSAELSIAPQLEFDVQGRGGPYVSVLGYLMGAATTSPPGAGLWIGGNGNVGIDLDLFVKTIQYEHPVFPFGPKLVWHSGTTPDQPYDTPTAPSSTLAPGLPEVTCTENCTAQTADGATISLVSSPTFQTSDQACIAFILNITAGKADYIGDGFAAMNRDWPDTVHPCARASVDGARCVSTTDQFSVTAKSTRAVAYCFGIEDENGTTITPFFFSLGGGVDFDLTSTGGPPPTTTTTTSPETTTSAPGSGSTHGSPPSTSTTAPQSTATTTTQRRGVTPGAFCKTRGARGVYKGKSMVCTTTATDPRLRWRAG